GEHNGFVLYDRFSPDDTEHIAWLYPGQDFEDEMAVEATLRVLPRPRLPLLTGSSPPVRPRCEGGRRLRGRRPDLRDGSPRGLPPAGPAAHAGGHQSSFSVSQLPPSVWSTRTRLARSRNKPATRSGRRPSKQLRHRLDQALRPHFGRRSERSRPRRARVPR